MLDRIARILLPTKPRQALGYWVSSRVIGHRWLLGPWLYLVHGCRLRNLELLPNWEAVYDHLGYKIIAPRDGLGIFFEILQLEVYDHTLKPKVGDVVIDVGAYVGIFTIKASLVVGEDGLVIAIEPEDRNFQYLMRNCEDLQNVQLVKKVVWENVCEKEFYLSPASGCHSLTYKHKEKVIVETETLDNIVKELGLSKIDFIKMDAEGASLEILKGSEEILKGDIKLSIAAYHRRQDGKPEMPLIISFLEERGFKISTWRKEYVYAEKGFETI